MVSRLKQFKLPYEFKFGSKLTKSSNTSFFVTLIIVERESICMMMDHVQDKKDIWLIYELCKG